jgi:hypothetical protein
VKDFIFFKKGTQISAVEKRNAEAATLLKEQGYEQQFEEVTALDAASALVRFNDIKKEEDLNWYAFAMGPAFTILIVIVLGILAYWFVR